MLMKSHHRVKLSLFMAVGLVLFWGWINGSFQAKPEIGAYVEWPEYAHRHLVQALPSVDRFIGPLEWPENQDAFLEKSFGEDGSTAEYWKVEPQKKEGLVVVVAIGEGLVLMAENWGSSLNGVVVIIHRVDKVDGKLIESMVAGLDTLEVGPGQVIKRGERLGVINDGRRDALQFEIRGSLGLGIGPGATEDLAGWLNPSDFLKKYGLARSQ